MDGAPKPGWFAQNFSETFWRPGILAGTLALPVGEGATPFVDAEDIAEVAAAALTKSGHSGRTYQLTGPRPIGFAEAVDLIAAATGRAVRYTPTAADTYTDHLAAHGTPPDAARLLADLLLELRGGRGPAVFDGVERALGCPPKAFEDFVTEAAAEGSWA